MRHSIEQLLDSEGLKAQSFEDAEDFLAYARSHAVPLVVLDVWMPQMSGLEVQKQLQVVSPQTKVIVITAREIPAVRAAALEGGAFAFLVKPFDDEVLRREETRELVNVTMSQLPPHYREALEAKYVNGRSVRDLAASSRQTEKAVESLLTRARKAFRATFVALNRALNAQTT